MAHAYTPGLKVTTSTIVRKERRLPLPGEVKVGKGARVKGEDIIARTELPGNVQTMNVGGLLGSPPADVPQMMLKKAGDSVKKDEVIAQSKGLFGLFKSEVKSLITGTIESVSEITGQVILREPPLPVEVDAYVEGTVTDIIENEGVIVQTRASMVQGIFGVGGEVRGIIHIVAKSPDEPFSPRMIAEDCRDRVVIGGSLITSEAIARAIEVKAKALVAGGIEDSTLRKFLGYDIGVAITGSEKKGLTLIVTEGFGEMKMADRTFSVLKLLEGKVASCNGATQIRAGVIRPEIIVPIEGDTAEGRVSAAEGGLNVGMQVRIIRQPGFGRIGKVTTLPVDLQQVESEARARVLEVELDDGSRITLPRANVEIIEE